MNADPRLPRHEETQLDFDGLTLCPWQDGDAKAIAAAYRDDPEIPRRTGFAYDMTVSQASAYILERRAGWNAGAKAAFGIFDEEHRLLGSISLLAIDWELREAEVGFWLARSARGRGIAVRVLERITRWAGELGLLQITATVEVTNEQSWHVLERAGFERQRTASANRVLHGESIDEYIYAHHIVTP